MEDIVLHLFIVIGAMFQSLTGIGFAMISGPFLLLSINDSYAIQVNILLNIILSLLLAPKIYKSADKSLLATISFGTIMGVPLGLIFYSNVDLNTLRLLVGYLVGIMTIRLIYTSQFSTSRIKNSIFKELITGFVSGILTVFLAMPGPALATYMGETGLYDKKTTRSTILLYFLFAYTLSILNHIIFIGVKYNAYKTALYCFPSMLIGVMLGILLVPKVSEKLFKILIIFVLASTSIAMIIGTLI
tara:strand:- start:89 stop:823 length:735 start_codon:yes stop_codon:yes gene_type:complete